MCGGTAENHPAISLWEGLSPRVRGNPDKGLDGLGGQGSIPACAGEPPQVQVSIAPAAVYPRVCGGTRMILARDTPCRGLSPRVRGNRPPAGRGDTSRRSIPACAGEPGVPRVSAGQGWVYPRVCGGTDNILGVITKVVGLSPRVRGNRP